MSTNSFFARLLRFVGILLMALTGGFTLLGGAGTTCVALNPTGFGGSMSALAPFQWLYILFVLAGIALGVMGIRATVLLAKGREHAYRDALITLGLGVLVGGFHMALSRALRGKSMPVDAVVYTTVLTLVLFALFRIPALWKGVDFTKAGGSGGRRVAGVAAILLGLLTLTIQYTMGPTHTWSGVNYANAFNLSMSVIGGACLLLGGLILAKVDRVRTWVRRGQKEGAVA